MWPPLQDLKLHTYLEQQCRVLLFVQTVRLGEDGTELHAKAAALGSAVVNVSKLAQRMVGFRLVLDSRGRIDVWQLASAGKKGVLMWHFGKAVGQYL